MTMRVAVIVSRKDDVVDDVALPVTGAVDEEYVLAREPCSRRGPGLVAMGVRTLSVMG